MEIVKLVLLEVLEEVVEMVHQVLLVTRLAYPLLKVTVVVMLEVLEDHIIQELEVEELMEVEEVLQVHLNLEEAVVQEEQILLQGLL